MALEFNIVDLIVLTLFLISAFIFYKKGFFLSVFDLLHVLLSFSASFLIIQLISSKLSFIPDGFERPVLWGAQLLSFLIFWFLLGKTKFYYFKNLISNYNRLKLIYIFDHPLGIIPGLVVAFVLVTIIFTLPLTLPSGTEAHALATNSFWGKVVAPEIYSINLSSRLGNFIPYNEVVYKITADPSSFLADKSLSFTTTDFIPKNLYKYAVTEQEKINQTRMEMGLDAVESAPTPEDSFAFIPSQTNTIDKSKLPGTPRKVEDEVEDSHDSTLNISSLRRSPSPSPKITKMPTQSSILPKATPAPTVKPTVRPTTKPTLQPSSSPVPTASPAPKPQEIIDIGQMESRVAELTNNERVKQGLEPLKFDLEISAVARSHSLDMSAREYFSHDTPEGVTPKQRLKFGGIVFSAMGENIAGHQSPELVIKAWMNSEGHRANILRDSYTRIGVGVAQSNKYGFLFTQNFTN